MPTGYSGTPLAKKLGLAPGLSAWFLNLPDSVRAEIAEAGFDERAAPSTGLQYAHIFVTTRADLERETAALRHLIAPNGMIWISWPKKASKVPTDITEDVIRDVILPSGLVDVKVCAVDAVWSGLKLMIRKEYR